MCTPTPRFQVRCPRSPAPEVAEASGTQAPSGCVVGRPQNPVVLCSGSCPFLLRRHLCLCPLNLRSTEDGHNYRIPRTLYFTPFLPHWTGPEGSVSLWRTAEDLTQQGPSDSCLREGSLGCLQRAVPKATCPFLMLYKFLLVGRGKVSKDSASRNFRNGKLQIICFKCTAKPARPF